MYSEYINNYNNAIETMSRCLQESEDFREFLAQGRADPESRGLDVTSFMILPIQRVPRYQMLLEVLHRFSTTLDIASGGGWVTLHCNVGFAQENRRQPPRPCEHFASGSCNQGNSRGMHGAV
jgi:hypothetical protein